MENKTQSQSMVLFCEDGAAKETAHLALNVDDTVSMTYQKGTLSKAIAWLKKHTAPNILVVELHTLDIDHLGQLAALTPPGTRVILLGEEIELSQYRQLIQLGVSDYLPLPLEPVVFSRAVQHALGQPNQIGFDSGTLHLVCGTSGGVGVSSIAANLAVGFAKTQTTALIDLNLVHSQHPILLGLDYQPSLDRLVAENERIDDILIKQHGQSASENLSLFYSEQSESYDIGLLIGTIKKLKRQFSHVVVDLPAYDKKLLDAIRDFSDNVVTIHDYSLQAGRRLEKILTEADSSQSQQHWIIGNVSRSGGKKRWTANQLQGVVKHSESTCLPFDHKVFLKNELEAKPIIDLGGKLAKSLVKVQRALTGVQ